LELWKKVLKAFGLSDRRFRVAILVSGNGSNMEALMQASEKGALPRIEIVLVISTRPQAGALSRAQAHDVKAVVVDSKLSPDAAFQAEVLKVLEDHHIDIVCLAGYLKKVGPRIVERFRGRILNIHPALLPGYGGPGMYGHFVHEAVLKASEKESGCSVHLVDDEFDHGPVLAQSKVPIQPGDTPEVLAQRILLEEHKLYPQVLAQFSERLRERAGSGEKQ
jgi:formyltetrahydrofolate-dependent phosphoribosylglycinamide formyltransferase